MVQSIFFAATSFFSVAFLFVLISRNWIFLLFSSLWFVIFVIAIVLKNAPVYFTALAFAVLIFLHKKSPSDKIIYYWVLLPVFPFGVRWLMSAPGIDIIFVLNQGRVLALCLLLPVLIYLIRKDELDFPVKKGFLRRLDIFVFLYVLLISVVNFRESDFLVAARQSLFPWTDVFLPYLVVSRVVKDVRAILIVLLFSAVALAVFAIIEWFFSHRVYDSIVVGMGGATGFIKVRNGGWRVYASMGNPLALGYFLMLMVPVAYSMRALFQVSWVLRWGTLAILLLGINATGSRAAVLMSTLGILVIMWWSMGRTFFRQTAPFVFLISMLVLYLAIVYGGDFFSRIDEGVSDGNFSYRFELMHNAVDSIIKNPIWGTTPKEYLNNPSLLKSLQGEGIIDLTNSYLAVLLRTGLVGLFLFLGIWWLCLRGLYREQPINSSQEAVQPLLMAMVVNTVVYIFVSSTISYMTAYTWLLVSLVAAFYRLNERIQV